MYEVFEALPQEKKNKILDAAVREFARHGYEKASTNTIVREAGISKGILFHYFSTKKELYRYVVFYCFEEMYRGLLKDLSFESTDYFERMMESSDVKLAYFIKNPDMYGLSVDIFKGNQPEIVKEIYDKYMPLLGEYFGRLSAGLDMTKFKDGVDMERLNEIVTWISDGLSNKIVKQLPDTLEQGIAAREVYLREFMSYMELLKKGVYK